MRYRFLRRALEQTGIGPYLPLRHTERRHVIRERGVLDKERDRCTVKDGQRREGAPSRTRTGGREQGGLVKLAEGFKHEAG